MNTFAKGNLLLDFYSVNREIGQGVNGIVYSATDLRNGNEVAVKNYTRGRGPLAGGLVELSNTLQVRHHNIVQCLDFYYGGEGETYLIYEFVNGGNLRQEMDAHPPPWPRKDLLRLIRQLLQALQCIHGNKMIHGDIKPENIMLARGKEAPWVVKLGDLGTASHVRDTWVKDRQPKGSPAYMAPERFYDRYTYNADIYSLGILVYELLVGNLPFLGEINQIASAHMRETPCYEPIEDSRWKVLLNGMLAKDPFTRIQSTDDALLLLNLSIDDASTHVQIENEVFINADEPCCNYNEAVPPYPLSEYKKVQSFVLPHRPLNCFAIGRVENPGILCSHNNFLTVYQGSNALSRSLFLPASGDTLVACGQDKFLYGGPGGVLFWKPGYTQGDVVYHFRQSIPSLASGSNSERFSWADARHMHFISEGQESAAKPLRSGGINVGLFQLPDGQTILLDGAAPTRMTLFDCYSQVLHDEDLDGCLLASSPFAKFQAVILRQRSANSSERERLSLLRFIDGKLSWFDLPKDPKRFQFLSSGFLWVDEKGNVQVFDHQGEVRSLGREPEGCSDLFFSDDATFYYSVFLPEGRQDEVTLTLYKHKESI